MNMIKKITLLLATMMLFAGYSHAGEVKQGVSATASNAPTRSVASLLMFESLSARSAGDMLTVVLNEPGISGLHGSVLVTVSKVLPNGNMKVAGEKWITIGHTQEFIRLSGVVKPMDISMDNTVRSSSLSNSEIAYSGDHQSQVASKGNKVDVNGIKLSAVDRF